MTAKKERMRDARGGSPAIVAGQLERPLTGIVFMVAFCAALFCAVGIAFAGASVPLASAQATPDASEVVSVSGEHLTHLIGVGSSSPSVFAYGSKDFYRSEDGGVTWTRVGERPPFDAVVPSRAEPLILLSGSRGDCSEPAPQRPPLYRFSQQGGWANVPGITGLRPLDAWMNGDVLLGVSCNGFELSRDGGDSWSPFAELESGFFVTQVAQADSSALNPSALVELTSGPTSRIYRLDLDATDEAERMTLLETFWGTAPLASAPGVDAIASSRGVLISRDGGENWELHRRGLEEVTLSVDPDRQPIPDDELGRVNAILAIAIDPDDETRMFVGTVDGVYTSTDGGETWRRVPGVNGSVRSLVMPAGGTRLLAETDGGIFVLDAR